MTVLMFNGAFFFHFVMSKGCKKEQVMQCLLFCTSDFGSGWSTNLLYKKTKHCLTCSFLHPSVMADEHFLISLDTPLKSLNTSVTVDGGGQERAS